tara:strand:+ start:802 stop:1158 length:357 start_codon:yes stop_codon:yes gene_type:complete
MIEIFGNLYYIDFEVLDKFLIIDKTNDNASNETITETFDKHSKLLGKEVVVNNNGVKEINGVKFEVIRNFIEDLGMASEANSDDYDSALGSRNLEKMSIKFKLAFNTLIFYNILRKED